MINFSDDLIKKVFIVLVIFCFGYIFMLNRISEKDDKNIILTKRNSSKICETLFLEDITGANSSMFVEENRIYKYASSYIMMPRLSFNTSCEEICELEIKTIPWLALSSQKRKTQNEGNLSEEHGHL